MEEEFQESEVMFSESGGGDETRSYYDDGAEDEAAGYNNNNKDADRIRSKKRGSSEPVDIPESNCLRGNGGDGFHGNEEGEEMVPPHVVVARRTESKMGCSVYAPSGRVLKGRNLCHLRNSVLRMTGFLES